MLMGKEWVPVPEKIRRLAETAGCRRTLRFADGSQYEEPLLAVCGEQALAVPVFDEHGALGRSLVDALWFSRTAEVVFEADGGRETAKIWVYRCHIAGPLYQEWFLKMQKEFPRRRMESVWELRIL